MGSTEGPGRGWKVSGMLRRQRRERRGECSWGGGECLQGGECRVVFLRAEGARVSKSMKCRIMRNDDLT